MSLKTSYQDVYQVSQRVILRSGDIFRATGGPYWRTATGEKVSIAARGPYKFVRHCQRGKTEWIEALDKGGNFCVLHIAGSRRRIDQSVTNRPYRIKGKKKTLTKRR